MRRDDRFEQGISSAWHVTETGSGIVRSMPDGLHLTVPPTPERHYSNAQISDYAYKYAHEYMRTKNGGVHFNFGWQPPLRMTVIAHAEIDGQSIDTLRGTAGFGFWNHPFSPDMKGLPRLPRAVWFFFGSPPNNMQLALDVSGSGWKATTIDATRKRALLLTPLALPAVLLMQIPSLYRRLWKPIQRALQIGEHSLDVQLLATKHTYTLDWQPNHIRFAVDGETVFETPFAPQGAAGFVAWLDNQYAIVTPQGRFGSGIIPVEHRQSLILERVLIEPL